MSLETIWGNRQIPFLIKTKSSGSESWPAISIIIPARNEERHIEQALQSVLTLDYPNYEILILNDRSTDQTEFILQRIAIRYPALHVHPIRELPLGWLGKNHALYVGSQKATGDYLLFADADVVMETSVLRRAIRLIQSGSWDHLAVIPEMITKNRALQIYITQFMLFFSFFYKPWQAQNPKSNRFMGIGAFNLIKRSTYFSMGSHQAIAMRPDDDLMLGKLVKKKGYRQCVAFGRDLLWVEWYHSFPEMIQGLMKNTFAALDYSISKVILASIAAALFFIFPLAGFFVPLMAIKLLAFLTILLYLGVYADSARFYHYNPFYGWTIPLASILGLYIMWRATFLTLWNRGISWRNTPYALSELKANKI